MAGSGDPAGIRLLYASMLAVEPAAVMIGKMADFHNIRRVMGRIHRKKQKHAELGEAG